MKDDWETNKHDARDASAIKEIASDLMSRDELDRDSNDPVSNREVVLYEVSTPLVALTVGTPRENFEHAFSGEAL